MIISIGNKKYDVEIADTPEKREKGLMDITKLPADKGMLFIWDQPQLVEMWMKDTKIPLDLVFINEDQEVTKVVEGQPDDETLIGQEDTLFVLEVNAKSGIQIGDTLEFSEDKEAEIVMKVLAPDGSTQMELQGGERIVSRRETKVLIRKAKKAAESNSESDYKALGKYMFKVLKGQDTREPEYVESVK